MTFAQARERKRHSRGAGILLALFITLGSVVFATAATSGVARAASCTVSVDKGDYVISQDVTCYGLVAAHKCMTVGTAGSTSAVECSDVVANTNASTGEAQLWGEGEYYCQGTYSQCEGMNVRNTFSLVSAAASYKCNDISPLCPNGGRAEVGTAHASVSEINAINPLQVGRCYSVTASDPAGNVITVYGASSAFHTSSALTNAIEVCFTP